MTPGTNAANGTSRQYLRQGWEICATAADECADPATLLQASRKWISTEVPSTAAGSLRAAGAWSLDGAERRFDAEDWWYRLRFDLPADLDESGATLRLDGLATLCDIWLNNALILQSRNMFLSHAVQGKLQPGRNELYLAFRSLDSALKQKRPRPRWRAPMIENQQLRWHRTTVLGRTPGWSPPAAAVGPWRPIWIDHGHSGVAIQSLHATVEGEDGLLDFRGHSPGGGSMRAPELLLLEGRDIVASATVTQAGAILQAQLRVPRVRKWWPHTHGTPALYEVVLRGQDTSGKETDIFLGRVGFRQVAVRSGTEGDFAVAINDTPIFCRGACWTPLDVVSLRSDPDNYRKALEQVVGAGFNMLRISGTFFYEDDVFFDLCDELGVLLWQDFMFASMDYPAQDAQFLESVREEATQQLQRWAPHPCVAVICGNSEVAQQAAMWGTARENWTPPLFEDFLRGLVTEHCPALPYWPSSACGGDFPHEVRTGTASYYGVGAYLRPLDDLRRSGLKFATECLAFANIPEASSIERMPGGAALRVHHPAWKRRAPRDLGAGWDFEDVRDHYLRQVFGVDPVQLRYSDHNRYLELGRRASAETMAAAFVEWRRRDSSCNGALVWFLRDLWDGAGWGIVDAQGQPKSAYYALRRVLQPRWIGITDEGLNGLSIHLGNEFPSAAEGRLELSLYREGQHLITRKGRDLNLPPRTTLEITTASMLDEFHDLTHSYRFGPLSCDLVTATFTEAASGATLLAVHLPQSQRHSHAQRGCEISAQAQLVEPGVYRLRLRNTGFARSVRVDAPGYLCDDQYFCMAPGTDMTLRLRAISPTSPSLHGMVSSLSSAGTSQIEVGL